MVTGICFRNIWKDENVIELEIIVHNYKSKFTNRIYTSFTELTSITKELEVFKTHIYGGIYDLDFGSFGQEYANGAFSARMHCQGRGQIYISINMQSEFYQFGKKYIADETKLHFMSEPALLDDFINNFANISKEIGNESILRSIND